MRDIPEPMIPNAGLLYLVVDINFILVLKMKSIHPKAPAFEVSDLDEANNI